MTYTYEQPSAIPVGKLFSSDANSYSIPLYQRNFTWGEEQISRLVHDILDEAEHGEGKDYFLGNLVVAPPADPADPFDVIDGQQRLTTLYILLTKLQTYGTMRTSIGTLQPLVYEAREKATRALRGMVDGAHGTKGEQSSTEDFGILRAANIIDQLLEDPSMSERFMTSRVLDYLLHRVMVIRMPIDRTTDLNRYFEIMNTRGAQLSPVDIVKARLLRHLTDPEDRALLNHVWFACSDMERYVAMTTTAGDTTLRKQVFGESWEEVPTPDFTVLRSLLVGDTLNSGDAASHFDSSAGTTSLSFDDALALYAHKDVVTEEAEVQGDDRFTSQVTFSTLLLHVLAVRRPVGGQDDRQLDDKLLVSRFSEELLRVPSTQREDWVRGFTTDLLRIRFLFDRYILKRDATLTTGHESTTDEEPGSWSLYRLTRAESRTRGRVGAVPRYSSTFARDESESGPGSLQRRILLLQSALRITYTSPRSMHWITDTLRYVTRHADLGEEIAAQGLLDSLESYALAQVESALRPRSISTVGNAASSPEGFPLGFAIPRIVFTYLDYLLVERMNEWDFTFSYRTSVEHFSPQLEDSEHASEAYHVRDRSLLDWLGNLALVTVSANSKFSNYQPPHKAQNRAARRQSMKLELMSQVAETDSWDDEDIKRHHADMVELLLTAVARRPQRS